MTPYESPEGIATGCMETFETNHATGHGRVRITGRNQPQAGVTNAGRTWRLAPVPSSQVLPSRPALVAAGHMPGRRSPQTGPGVQAPSAEVPGPPGADREAPRGPRRKWPSTLLGCANSASRNSSRGVDGCPNTSTKESAIRGTSRRCPSDVPWRVTNERTALLGGASGRQGLPPALRRVAPWFFRKCATSMGGRLGFWDPLTPRPRESPMSPQSLRLVVTLERRNQRAGDSGSSGP
jgi:hypothetical protein